jgi:radical SAM superfamily enzyme YgiQ (UPF0313 family)
MAKMAFVQHIRFEYLGVMYVSSLLKKNGHQVEMFIPKRSQKIGHIVKELSAFKPDLVGFSCTTGTHKWALKCAEAIKHILPTKTVFGGPHPTYFPEIIDEPPVDIICRGEGEYPLLDLADKIDRDEDITSTLSCWFKKNGKIVRNDQRPLIEDLNHLPFPDRELYTTKYPSLRKSQKVFIASRGCPFNCTFCFNHQYKKLYKGKGTFVRYRSVENLIQEIQEVSDREKEMRTVYMQDDTLILDKEWVQEFADRYAREIHLPFICLIRADLTDESTIQKLSEACCKNVFFGIETGSEYLRNTLLKKGVTDEQICYTAQLLKKYGIKFRTYNMLGLPGETMEEAYKTIELNMKIKTDYPWCALFHPFPGTELGKYAEEHHLLESPIDNSLPSFFKTSRIKSIHKNELINLQKLFFWGVRFPRLMPVIKRIIKRRPNVLFEILFLIGYAWSYMRSENLTLREVWSIGWMNLMRFFFKAEQP